MSHDAAILDETMSPGAHPDPQRAGRIDVNALPIPLRGTIPVASWFDPILASIGHEARSSYVELFWLGILGPSATLLLRRLATGLDHHPEGFALPVVDTARSLGLGTPLGRQSPFVRAVQRCCLFKVARFAGPVLEVRLHVPSLQPGQLRRLPESLQQAHAVLEARHRERFEG